MRVGGSVLKIVFLLEKKKKKVNGKKKSNGRGKVGGRINYLQFPNRFAS